jgi:hypothetical protein
MLAVEGEEVEEVARQRLVGRGFGSLCRALGRSHENFGVVGVQELGWGSQLPQRALVRRR